MNKAVFIAAALMLFCACNEPMESVSEITKLRILAIQAEPPEIDLNGTTNQIALSALIADPLEYQEIQVLWAAFPGLVSPTFGIQDVGFGLYADLEKHILSREDDPNADQIFEGDFVVDSYIVPLRTDLNDVEQVTIFTLICAGGTIPIDLDDPIGFGGDDANLDSIEDLCLDGDSILAAKTFTVRLDDSNTSETNANPILERLDFDSNCLDPLVEEECDSTSIGCLECEDPGDGCFECDNDDGCRGVNVPLDAIVFEDSFQDYEKEEFGEITIQREYLYISWFITGGSFENTQTGFTDEEDFSSDNNWFPPREGNYEEDRLFVVTHDTRGGLSWEIFNVAAWAKEVDHPGDQCLAE